MKPSSTHSLSGAVLFLALLAVVGCQEAIDETRTRPAPGVRAERVWSPRVDRDLGDIQSEGVLRLIVFPGAPSYLVFNGEETGFDYELTALFAREWNLRLEVVAPRPGEDPFTLLNEGARRPGGRRPRHLQRSQATRRPDPGLRPRRRVRGAGRRRHRRGPTSRTWTA